MRIYKKAYYQKVKHKIREILASQKNTNSGPQTPKGGLNTRKG